MSKVNILLFLIFTSFSTHASIKDELELTNYSYYKTNKHEGSYTSTIGLNLGLVSVSFRYGYGSYGDPFDTTNPFLSRINHKMIIDRVSKNGRFLYMSSIMTGHYHLFKHFFPAGVFKQDLVFKLVSCDSIKIEEINVKEDNINSIIDGFYDWDIDNVATNCTYELSSILRSDLITRDGYVNSDDYSKVSVNILKAQQEHSKVKLSFNKDGFIKLTSITNPGTTELEFRLAEKKEDSKELNRASIAIQAAKNFSSLISEYVDNIILSKDMTKAERVNIINVFINNKKAQLKKEMKDYRDNFDHLSIFEKVSTQRLIGKSFEYAKFFEQTVNNDTPIRMNRVMRSQR